MAEKKKPREKKYDKPLAVKGGFLDVIQAAVKDANKKSKKPKN